MNYNYKYPFVCLFVLVLVLLLLLNHVTAIFISYLLLCMVLLVLLYVGVVIRYNIVVLIPPCCFCQFVDVVVADAANCSAAYSYPESIEYRQLLSPVLWSFKLFFSNIWRLWYHKEAHIFHITHVKFHSWKVFRLEDINENVPGYSNHN